MDFKGTVYWQIYGNIFDFHKKFADIQESDAYWDSMISEGSSVYKKYENKPEGEFAKQLIFCVIDELDRRWKSGQHNKC